MFISGKQRETGSTDIFQIVVYFQISIVFVNQCLAFRVISIVLQQVPLFKQSWDIFVHLLIPAWAQIGAIKSSWDEFFL